MSQSLEEVRYKQRGSSESCRTFYLSNWAFLEIQKTMKELITKQADHFIYGSFFFAVKGKGIKLFTKDGQEGVHISSEAALRQNLSGLDWEYMLNVTDVWDPPPFFTIPSFPPSHFLWNMITNDEGISSEIWDQFIGGDVPSITF